nr:hypothetical protein [Candidatus Cloacimonas sp.]
GLQTLPTDPIPTFQKPRIQRFIFLECRDYAKSDNKYKTLIIIIVMQIEKRGIGYNLPQLKIGKNE